MIKHLAAVAMGAVMLTAATASAADLVVYTSHGETTSGPILDAFKTAHPDINVTIVRGGTGEVVERLRAEAGNPTADILWGGPTQTFEENASLFQPYESASDADMVTLDPNHIWHPYTVLLQPIIVSTKRVSADDMPATQADLVSAKWKDLGGLIIPDPAKSGTGYTILSALAGENGWDFIGDLATDARIAPGSDDAFNAVRDGEAAVGWINEDLGAKWKAEGLPIEVIYPEDAVTGQVDAQAIVAGAPHLDEAKAFIDFLGSEQSHEIVRDATIRRSARVDVTPPDVLPDLGTLNIVSPVDPRPVVVARFQEALNK
ncbi:extracellular solute-binding protein [Martelella endophytica]|uniref:Iron ABC transporter substrate-binding protein n=1 Tax=Martelella endophytica TaxID=1486262 RepID=A0A0D5LQ16_MAREN|nr:extracellular solute-binding protein [Martelella endophytica]AJY45413.1 iron ABC transporter substrate-binding protein [Martelella endophytica]